MTCYMGDSFILLGRSSLPVGREKPFFDSQIGPLFETYRQKLQPCTEAATRERPWAEFAKMNLCRPEAYFTFGRFDLLWACAADDPELAVEGLRPFSSLRPGTSGEPPEAFDHQAIVCPVPRFNPIDGTRGPADLLIPWSKARRSSAGEDHVLVGMTQLKTNSLLGSFHGSSFLRLLVRFLRHAGHFNLMSGKCLPSEKCVSAFVLETYSWHELVLLLWSDSFGRMAEVIEGLIRFTVGDICTFLERGVEGERPRDLREDRALVRSIRRGLEEHCSFLKGVHPPAGSEHPTVPIGVQDLLERHAFLDSVTSFGVRLDLAESNRLLDVGNADKLTWSTSWYVEAGHDLDVWSRLAGRLQDRVGIFGGADIWHPVRKVGSSRALVRHVLRGSRYQLRDVFGIAAGSTNVGARTPREIRARSAGSPRIADYHAVFRPCMLIPSQRIEALNELFRRSRFCKVASERVLAMISAYNEGISDNIMFSSFSELHPFVEWALRVTELEIKEQMRRADQDDRFWQLVRQTNWRVDEFEHAVRNRYRGSHRLGEVSEVNLEFRGGVQQLITALHGALNAVGRAMQIAPALVWIGGHAGASSSGHCPSVHLNPAHAFQPEHFAAICGHELAHSWLLTPSRDRTPEQKMAAAAVTARESTSLLNGQITERVAALAADRAEATGPTSPDTEQERRRWQDWWLRLLNEHHLVEEAACDLVGYYFSYRGSTELFAWWSFHHFVQEALAARVGSDAISDFFGLPRLARWYIVIAVVEEDSSAKAKAIQSITGLFRTHQTANGVPASQSDALARAALLLARETLRSQAGQHLQRLRAAAEQRYRRSLADGFPTTVPETAIAELDSQAKAALTSGKVLELVGNLRTPAGSFAFAHILLTAYLRILAEADGWELASVRHDEVGNPCKDAVAVCPPIMFDSRGGTYVADARMRREYAMWRSTLVMSLWDMATKNQAMRWLERLNKFDARR